MQRFCDRIFMVRHLLIVWAYFTTEKHRRKDASMQKSQPRQQKEFRSGLLHCRVWAPGEGKSKIYRLSKFSPLVAITRLYQ